MSDAVYQVRASDLAEDAEALIEVLNSCSAQCPDSERVRIAAKAQAVKSAVDRFRAAEKLLKELSA